MTETEHTVSQTFARVLSLHTDGTSEAAQRVFKALASDKRLAILQHLSNRTSNLNEIAEAMHVPASTATMHINILEDAGLVHTELKPASRGVQKICSRVYDRLEIDLPRPPRETLDHTVDTAMPIGAYVDCQTQPTCGLAGEFGIIGELDDPTSFYHPDRIHAQILWFRCGYVEYRFPNRVLAHQPISLQLSMELCSEAPHSNPDWPSPITLWINGVEIGTWVCPGDFGGQRGALTPQWWEEWNTQHGVLKRWRVTPEGAYIDGVPLSGVRLDALNLADKHYISVRLGVKNEGVPGGLNLFGSKFGNYPQDLLMRVRYRPN